jgi:hypothetical protein
MANRAQRRSARKEAVPVEGTEPAPTDVPTEITLVGRDGELRVRLFVPKSLGVRYEVTYAIAESEIKAGCAALGVCSVTIQKHVPWTKKSAALAYGADVLEWLLSQGVAYGDVLNAGRLAWWHVSRGLIPAREVEDAEGFSGPTTGGSTG